MSVSVCARLSLSKCKFWFAGACVCVCPRGSAAFYSSCQRSQSIFCFSPLEGSKEIKGFGAAPKLKGLSLLYPLVLQQSSRHRGENTRALVDRKRLVSAQRCLRASGVDCKKGII